MTTKFTWLQKLKPPSWWEEKIRSGLWWLWQKIKQYPFVMGIIVVLLLIAFTFAAYLFKWDWTGFNSGTSQITITSTSKGNYTATISQPSKSLWDWLLLVSSVATTLAIAAAAVWFVWGRAPARKLKITLALAGYNNGVAIIRVQLKNFGRTLIETERTENKQISESCYFSAKEVKVFDPKPIMPLVVRGFDSGRILIFKNLKELEPGEVVSEDVPLALKITLFEVHVEFHPLEATKAWRATEAWGATAVFNVDEKTKSSSTIDLPTEQTATSGEIVSS